MKTLKLLFTLAFVLTGINLSYAQSSSLSKSLGMYVFPAKNQDQKTQ